MAKRGYVALHRSVFDNPKLAGKFSKREAWIWLIAHAAWAPSVHKLKRGALAVGRGELAASTRGLADTWGWSEAGVRRFVNLLKREKMCLVALPDALKLVKGMVITVCNYDKFQNGEKAAVAKVTRYPTRSTQQSLLLPITCSKEEPKKEDIDNRSRILGEAKRAGRLVSQPGPRHGTRSKHGTIFLRTATSCWLTHAADFEQVVGYEPIPRDGGNWFWPAGEAERPAHLHHLRPAPPAPIRKTA